MISLTLESLQAQYITGKYQPTTLDTDLENLRCPDKGAHYL